LPSKWPGATTSWNPRSSDCSPGWLCSPEGGRCRPPRPCAGRGWTFDVLDALTALVDHSLVRRGSHAPTRFRMLETIREFAAERLADSGEEDDLRRRRARDIVASVEAAEPHLLRDPPVLDRLETEHDNIPAALRSAIESGDAESGLRIVGALWRFWQIRSHLAEGRGWTEAAFRSLEAADAMGASGWTAVALKALAVVAIYEGWLERGIRLARVAESLMDLAGGQAPPSIVGLEDLLELVGEGYRWTGSRSFERRGGGGGWTSTRPSPSPASPQSGSTPIACEACQVPKPDRGPGDCRGP
jgi:hypothetical protein